MAKHRDRLCQFAASQALCIVEQLAQGPHEPVLKQQKHQTKRNAHLQAQSDSGSDQLAHELLLDIGSGHHYVTCPMVAPSRSTGRTSCTFTTKRELGL